jgi:uncharacterized protein (DUF305 family)
MARARVLARARRAAGAAVTLLAVVGCSPPSRDARSRPADPPDTADTTPYVAGMRGMAGPDSMVLMSAMPKMTGDPDHDFLRMLSDRHAGLMLLARAAAADSRGTPGVHRDAARLAEEERSALDSTTHMLAAEYRDAYEPDTALRSAVYDSGRGTSGVGYDRAFYTSVVRHRRETVAIIDRFLEGGRRADLKAMGLALRSTQARQITALERRIAKR